MLACVRSLSNVECVGETLRAVLDDLAQIAPDWLVKQLNPDWFERYSHRVENYRLPKAERQRAALAQQIGADGLHLLHALEKPDAPERLKNEASVHLLRQVWRQYYNLAGGKAKWRASPQENAEEGIIRSFYDPQPEPAKSGRRSSWDTKFISPKPVPHGLSAIPDVIRQQSLERPGSQPPSPAVTQVVTALTQVAGVAGKLLWEAIDLVFNVPGMMHEVQMLADPNANGWPKRWALFDLTSSIVMDINMLDGVGEAA